MRQLIAWNEDDRCSIEPRRTSPLRRHPHQWSGRERLYLRVYLSFVHKSRGRFPASETEGSVHQSRLHGKPLFNATQVNKSIQPWRGANMKYPGEWKIHDLEPLQAASAASVRLLKWSMMTKWCWAPSLMLLWQSYWPSDRVWRVWESRWYAIFIRKSCPKPTQRFQNQPETPIRSVRPRLWRSCSFRIRVAIASFEPTFFT